MNTKLETIEDCLEIITGLVRTHALCKFNIDTNDKTIINSISRQVFKGKALTDRQFALMQIKLSMYESQFVNNFLKGVEELKAFESRFVNVHFKGAGGSRNAIC